MALIIDELIGELLAAGLEDYLGRPGAEADDPIAAGGGVFSSAVLQNKIKQAQKELNEILAEGGELTDSDIGRIAAKHELPGEVVRQVREFANAERARRMPPTEFPELPDEVRFSEPPPVPDDAKVAAANKAAAETDVPTLTSEQRAARKASALDGPKSIDEIRELVKQQDAEDALTPDRKLSMKQRGEARIQKVKDVGGRIKNKALDLADADMKSVAKAAAGIPTPTLKGMAKAGTAGAILAGLGFAANSIFGTKQTKKKGEPQTTEDSVSKINELLKQMDEKKESSQEKAFREFDEASERIMRLLEQ